MKGFGMFHIRETLFLVACMVSKSLRLVYYLASKGQGESPGNEVVWNGWGKRSE